MLRQAFISRLRKIGEIEIPEGHLRRNKGVTTYFFAKEQLYNLQTLLEDCGLQESHLSTPYPQGTSLWAEPAVQYPERRVLLYDNDSFIGVVVQWPS